MIASRAINLSLLRELQSLFHKEASELIELYVNSARKKIAMLHKALEEENLDNFRAAAQELRYRSIDIGAVQFSFCCLSLEMAAQERCIERLQQLTVLLENQFHSIYQELESLMRVRA